MRPRGAGPVVAVRELRGSRRRGGDGHRVPHRAHGRLRLVANRYTAALYGRPGPQLSRSYTGPFLPERPRHPAVRDRLRVLGTSPGEPAVAVGPRPRARARGRLGAGLPRRSLSARHCRAASRRPSRPPSPRPRPPGWLPLGSRRVRTGCANGSPPGCGASRQVIVNREDGCHDASPHDPRRRSCRPRAWPFATELGRLMPREKPE
jgi:hypothetical protein